MLELEFSPLVEGCQCEIEKLASTGKTGLKTVVADASEPVKTATINFPTIERL